MIQGVKTKLNPIPQGGTLILLSFSKGSRLCKRLRFGMYATLKPRNGTPIPNIWYLIVVLLYINLAQQLRESCLSQKFVLKYRECCLSLSEYVLNYQNVLTIIEICITFYIFWPGYSWSREGSDSVTAFEKPSLGSGSVCTVYRCAPRTSSIWTFSC